MAIEGPLRELALSDVFQLLDLSRKTGTLTIHTDARSRPAQVLFDRGAVAGIDLPGRADKLGSLLLRAGKISERQLEDAIGSQREQPGRQLGEVLVELGFVSDAEIRRQLRFQIEEAACDLMGWDDGYFRFEEGVPDVPPISLRITSESLLMEAARRIDEWSTLEEKVPHMEVVPALARFDAAGETMLDLHPDEWEVLTEIDGRRTLRDIAVQLGRGDFAVAKTAYGLVTTGVIEITEDAAGPEPEDAGPTHMEATLEEARGEIADGEFARANRMAEDLLQRHPERADVHLLHGQALLGLGRWKPATDALERAARLDPLSARAYRDLGVAAARNGDFRRARAAWSNFLRLPEVDPGERNRIARVAEAATVLDAVLNGGGA